MKTPTLDRAAAPQPPRRPPADELQRIFAETAEKLGTVCAALGLRADEPTADLVAKIREMRNTAAAANEKVRVLTRQLNDALMARVPARE